MCVFYALVQKWFQLIALLVSESVVIRFLGDVVTVCIVCYWILAPAGGSLPGSTHFSVCVCVCVLALKQRLG